MVDFNARTKLKLLAGAATLLATACGGGGSSSVSPPPPPPTPPSPPPPPPGGVAPPDGLLKNTFAGNFDIGAAIQANQISGGGLDADLLTSQFNSITAEYEMKPDQIAPTEGVYNFATGDALVAFAEANNLKIRGHALLWHQTTPAYFLQGTKTEIKTRLQQYITDVVTHFKGKVYAWDVVNEVITDDGSAPAAPYRNSNWHQAVGSAEYIDWALEAARAADPTALLFINEYNTELPEKRDRFLQVVQDLIARGIPLDGTGHQMHLNVDTPATEVTAAIDAIDNLVAGLINHVTELDISVYNDPGSCYNSQTNCDADYGATLPSAVVQAQAQLYRDVFDGFAARSSVTSVTTWGISDAQSWLNNFPVTRTNYPLLFDRDRLGKVAYQAVTDASFVI